MSAKKENLGNRIRILGNARSDLVQSPPDKKDVASTAGLRDWDVKFRHIVRQCEPWCGTMLCKSREMVDGLEN